MQEQYSLLSFSEFLTIPNMSHLEVSAAYISVTSGKYKCWLAIVRYWFAKVLSFCGCLENEDLRPKNEDPLKNEDLENKDPLENKDLQNEDP